jgi:hypothetical protein
MLALAPLALLLGGWGPSFALPSRAGGEGFYDVRTAEVPDRHSYTVGIAGTGYGIARDQFPGALTDRTVLDGGLQMTYGAGGWAELYAMGGSTFDSAPGPDIFSYGDWLVGGKVALPWRNRWLLTAMAASMRVPLGNRARGLSTDSWDPAVTALLTVPLPESNVLTSARLHFNLGYRWFGDSRGRAFAGRPLYFLEPVYPEGSKDRLDLRLALEIGSRRLTLFSEILLDRILNDDVSWGESPLFLTPGLRFTLGESFSFLLGSKVALASDDESTDRYRPPSRLYPDWQLVFSLTYSRFGPDVDRDDDGVPDFRDRCPRVPEDPDGWEDEDGCPDDDNDGDRIPDEFDQEPDAAEDYDTYLDTDGIPDPDNDRDGIPDEDDACPLTAEDYDGIADDDGCPETDFDGDGVADNVDACPEEAETMNRVDDEDGCPDSLGMTEAQYLWGVLWEESAVAPSPVSYYDLNALAETLRGDATRIVELRLHASPRAPGGLDLAYQRAEYLKEFLVASGVAPARIRAVVRPGQPPRQIPGPGGGEPGPGRSVVEVVPVSDPGSGAD